MIFQYWNRKRLWPTKIQHYNASKIKLPSAIKLATFYTDFANFWSDIFVMSHHIGKKRDRNPIGLLILNNAAILLWFGSCSFVGWSFNQVTSLSRWRQTSFREEFCNALVFPTTLFCKNAHGISFSHQFSLIAEIMSYICKVTME